MNTPFPPEDLAAVEVCFAVASSLLYNEPTAVAVAEQVVSRQFASAPFADDNEYARAGLALLDDWCAEVAKAADKARPAASSDAAVLAESPVLVERVNDLRREWLRLFVGLGTPEASCLESFYVEPNSHMFGKNTLVVRAAYRRHGLQVEKLHAEPDDHLGLMLGFLSRLMAEERMALEAGDGDEARALAEEQETFLAEHVLPWLAAWRYAVEKHARSDYYRGLGDFVFGLCVCYAERFGIRYDGEAQAFKKRLG